MEKLDPNNVIKHRLYRESCVIHGTEYIKDLRQLERKLKNCIMIDNNRSGYLFQAKNAIPINSWFDNQNDTALKDLIPVLETTLKNIKDVRYMLDANTKYHYSGS